MKIANHIGKKCLSEKRQGAAQKTSAGQYKEPSSVMRIPAVDNPIIHDFIQAYANKQQKASIDAVNMFTQPATNAMPIYLTLFHSKVAAGFPSPADDHVEKRLDPSEFLIDQADATFFVTIQGESMIEVGLMPNDKAVVDRSKIPVIGDIVLAMIDGEFTIKTLSRQKNGNPRLLPANASGKYSIIDIKEPMQFEIWGVVTGSFRRFR